MKNKEKKQFMNKKMKTALIVGLIIVVISLIVTVVIISKDSEEPTINTTDVVGTTITEPIVITPISPNDNTKDDTSIIDVGQGNVPEEVETYVETRNINTEIKEEKITEPPLVTHSIP